MNKNAYIAELTQLLYYMAEWDRAAAIKKYEGMLDASDDPDALMKELGSPMKLAVTLSRGYTPSDPNAPPPEPEPEPEPAEEPPAEETVSEEAPVEELPVEQPPAQEPPAEEAPVEEAPTEEPPAEEAPVEEPPAEEISVEETPAPEASAEEAPDPDETVVEVVEIRSDEPAEQAPEAPAEQPPAEELPKIPAIQLPTTGEDAIFSEIFSAATEAQTAVAVGAGAGRPRPRPAVLILYILACVIVGVPVTLVLVAVGLVIFAIALAALLFGVYIFTLFGVSGFPGLGNHLVILGAGILALTAAAAIACLGVWFMRTAAVGFPRFLIRFGREHGYTQEGRA